MKDKQTGEIGGLGTDPAPSADQTFNPNWPKRGEGPELVESVVLEASASTYDPITKQDKRAVVRVLEVIDRTTRKSTGIRASRTTRHQYHEIELDTGNGVIGADLNVRVLETWRSGTYNAERIFPLMKLTHLLLNITDVEIQAISDRSVDYTGQMTTPQLRPDVTNPVPNDRYRISRLGMRVSSQREYLASYSGVAAQPTKWVRDADLATPLPYGKAVALRAQYESVGNTNLKYWIESVD
jgi:hypothetical protein